MEKHEFFEFMKSIKESMAAEYEQIRRRAREDPGTAGDRVEESWAEFLRNWLPANYPVVTKGRILSDEGKTSPQVDILILCPSYPMHLRNRKLYFAGGVVAAFECKLTLKKEHVKRAFQNALEIKRILPKREGTPYEELHQRPIFGLLAHSHQLKKSGQDAQYKILDYLTAYEFEYCEHPSEMIDIVCVADTATYILGKSIYIGPYASKIDKKDFDEIDQNGGVSTAYYVNDERAIPGYDPKGDILGSLIFDLTVKMAFEDANLRPFADYLGRIGMYGGIGKLAFWNTAVLSKPVIRRLMKIGYEEEQWSKWQALL